MTFRHSLTVGEDSGGGRRSKTSTPIRTFPHHKRLCHNWANAVVVILNGVKNLIISSESIIEILRLMPQNDIPTQSLMMGEGKDGGGRLGPSSPHLNPPPPWGEELFFSSVGVINTPLFFFNPYIGVSVPKVNPLQIS